MTVLADTGALYALVDASDAWHKRIVAWWAGSQRRVLVPVTVLPEVTYLLATRIGADAEAAFLQSIVNGELEVEPIEPEDIARAAELVGKYSDLRLGFVDASLVAIAERLGIRELLTTDRRHFSVVKPSHERRLVLAP